MEPVRKSTDELLPLVYDELRRLATQWMVGEHNARTLQPTALVHEAYVRLGNHGAGWEDEAHFFAAAAKSMRRVLVEHARSKQALKRGGGGARVEFHDEQLSHELDMGEILALNDALDDLEAVDPRLGEVVNLRCFGGLTVEQTANALDISIRTVHREWALGRAWLLSQIQ